MYINIKVLAIKVIHVWKLKSPYLGESLLKRLLLLIGGIMLEGMVMLC